MSARRDRATVDDRLARRRREVEADITYRKVVRPLGNKGLHVLKNRDGGIEFVASGPQHTFAPESIVPTGSHTGKQGEVILIEAPPGRRGVAPPTSPPVVIVPANPVITEAAGAEAMTTSSFPITITGISIFGTSFDPSNWIEIIDEHAGADQGADIAGGVLGPAQPGLFILTGINYISATEWQFDIQTNANAVSDMAFRVRLWNLAPDAGGTFSSEDPDFGDPLGDLEDAYYYLEGV